MIAHMAGRPTKLTEKIATNIVATLSEGSFIDTAAKANGVTVQTVYNWMERGEADSVAGKVTDYAAFFEAVTCARASAESNAVKAIRDAMPDDWRAAAWFLERTFPKRYGKRVLPMLAEDKGDSDKMTDGSYTYADLIAVAESADDGADT